MNRIAPFTAVLALAGAWVGAADAPRASSGKDVFRFDTFGNETFWTDTLRLHEAIANGGRPHHRALRRPEGGRGRAAPGDPARPPT